MGWQKKTITLVGDEPNGVFDVNMHVNEDGVIDRMEDRRFFGVGTRFEVDGAYCKVSTQRLLQDRYTYDIKTLSEPHDKGAIYDESSE